MGTEIGLRSFLCCVTPMGTEIGLQSFLCCVTAMKSVQIQKSFWHAFHFILALFSSRYSWIAFCIKCIWQLKT
jgi:hypothetical protein